MKHTWKPKEDSGFTGCVELNLPNIDEGFDLLRDISLKRLSDEVSTANTLETVRNQVKMCEKFVLKVDLVHGESGKKFDSYQDLFMYQQGRKIVYSINDLILNGFDLGKH